MIFSNCKRTKFTKQGLEKMSFGEFKQSLLREFSPTIVKMDDFKEGEFLQSPQEFFNFLKVSIKGAKRRIILSSLYIGNT